MSDSNRGNPLERIVTNWEVGKFLDGRGKSYCRFWRIMPAMKRYSFTAKIEAGPSGGAFVIFPYDVEKEFGVRGRVPHL